MIFVALAFPEEFKQKLYNDKESEEAAELLKMGLAIFIAAFGVSIGKIIVVEITEIEFGLREYIYLYPTAIMLSFVWVVYSFFVELREEEENPRSRYQPDAKGYYPTAPAWRAQGQSYTITQTWSDYVFKVPHTYQT